MLVVAFVVLVVVIAAAAATTAAAVVAFFPLILQFPFSCCSDPVIFVYDIQYRHCGH